MQNGSTTFVPKNWEKTYFDWMENIQPWCISRQLWWGHQIPAWYGPDGKVFVAETEEEAVGSALGYYAEQEVITPDAGARDGARSGQARGASSRATRTCSTPGSPRRCGRSRRSAGRTTTPELKRYYPTDVLVTGFDIIFFWVARMMMMGLHFMKEVPFHDVYIHALVRDEKGAKMSKSKGNVIDPLASDRRLRRRRAALHAGRDGGARPRHQAVDPARRGLSQFRDQALERRALRRDEWLRRCRRVSIRQTAKETLNRWIAHETARAAREVTEAIEAYRFNEAASAAYRFVWNIYCDWYLELAKPVLHGPGRRGQRPKRTRWSPGRSTKS